VRARAATKQAINAFGKIDAAIADLIQHVAFVASLLDRFVRMALAIR
jgi:hypothetical protein